MPAATTDRRLLTAIAVAAWWCLAGDALAATAGCLPISSVPYEIDAAGNYCLTGPLTHAGGDSAALLVMADDVTIDLNGFTLRGSGGPGTLAIGIFADTRRGLIIENGAITGFLFGVFLTDNESEGWTSGGGHVLRDLRASDNYFRGIRTEGRGVLIERCHVSNTGGTTVFGPGNYSFGIEVFGPGAQVVSNIVDDTVAGDGGEAVSISLSAASYGTVVEGNILGNEALPATGRSFGVWVGGDSQVLVVNNRFTRLLWGTVYAGGTSGLYRDNLATGVIVPLIGGTDGGNNQ